MLRQPIRGVRMPPRFFNQPTQPAAWNGAWRRLFTSQTGTKLPAQLWRQRVAPFEGMLSSLRGGQSLPSHATAQGALRGALRRGFRFSARRKAAKPTPDAAASTEPTSLTARLKKLSKEYGWVTVGVYFALSVLDFPFCFALVRIVGVETIGKMIPSYRSTSAPITGSLMANACRVIPESVQESWRNYWSSVKDAETETLGDDGEISEKVEMVGWGVEKAEERNREEASLATQLALAYAIHKSFIFIRVPLTAALTPKIVKVLRSWGYNIGKKRVPKVPKGPLP
ncbi:hypothetical protein G7046_g9157 [Stylonectria norvegica]|nr:hypothetical protein G7046_g9157 [Stylonectria norvegica]